MRVSLVMVLHALEKVLEGLNLAWDREPATVVKPKLLLSLFQQQFKQGVAEIASRNDKPPELRPNINRQIAFGDVDWRFRAMAAVLVRITIHDIG